VALFATPGVGCGFIQGEEKRMDLDLMRVLQQARDKKVAELKALDDAMAALGIQLPGTEGARGGPSGVRKRKRRTMSAAQRKAVSARMKKYWAARKKAKG
jgi:hypothetical protein